jgi:hypothetical protein
MHIEPAPESIITNAGRSAYVSNFLGLRQADIQGSLGWGASPKVGSNVIRIVRMS